MKAASDQQPIRVDDSSHLTTSMFVNLSGIMTSDLHPTTHTEPPQLTGATPVNHMRSLRLQDPAPALLLIG